MRKSFVLGSLLIATAATIGCNNVVREPIQPRQDIYPADGPAQVFLDSTRLRSDTAVDTPVVVRDANGLLKVTLPIRSVINRQLYVEYRAVFFDRDHVEIDHSPWHDKTLAANIPDNITIGTTDPRAASFEIHIRYPIGTEM